MQGNEQTLSGWPAHSNGLHSGNAVRSDTIADVNVTSRAQFGLGFLGSAPGAERSAGFFNAPPAVENAPAAQGDDIVDSIFSRVLQSMNQPQFGGNTKPQL